MEKTIKFLQLNDSTLISLNKRGIIPGPTENEDSFLKRANSYLESKAFIEKQLPFDHQHRATDAEMKEARQLTKKQFSISPDWVPLYFSSYRLLPWQGACTWIIEPEKNATPISFLQLHFHFKNSPTYLKIYQRDELIAHELCHAARMAFEEPIFEEILAYRISQSSFRRWLGPIATSTTKIVLFLILTFLVMLLPLFTTSFMLFSAGLLGLIGIIISALIRLQKRHQQFFKSMIVLTTILPKRSDAEAVLFRLTDDEIIRFSKMSSDEVKKYMKEQDSLRWKVIRLAYF